MLKRAGGVAVVEDDPGTRKSLERLLRASGYETSTFESAEDYLQDGRGDAFVLVVDIHLPGMSGLELRRQMLRAGTMVPVIFITAYDDAGLRSEALATGHIDYLLKPFDALRLIAAVERSRHLRR